MNEETSRSPTKEQDSGYAEQLVEDTQLVAYLMYKGLGVIPLRDTNDHNHIVFMVYGDRSDIDKYVGKFYTGDEVNIKDYVRCFKNIKTQMYNLKTMKG